MRFARNFLILLLAAASIILASVLLVSHVNKALGYFIIPILVVFYVIPLSQRLRRTGKLGKLLTKDDLIEKGPWVITMLIGIGSGWGLSHIFERWHEGWWWVGWMLGIIVVPFVLIGVMTFFGFHYGWLGRGPKQIERSEQKICEKVAEKPGISHTALCQSVKFYCDHYEVNRLVRQLLKQNRLRCEQRGRVRRYFTQA